MTHTRSDGLTEEFAARLMVLDTLFDIDPDRGLAKAADDLLLLPKDLSNQEHHDNLHAYKQKVNGLVAKYRDRCSQQALTEFGDNVSLRWSWSSSRTARKTRPLSRSNSPG